METPVYRGVTPWSVWGAIRTSDRTAPGGAVVSRSQLLKGVGPDSCITVPSILVCATKADEFTLWQLPAGLG